MPESISTVINPVSGYARNFTWEYTYDANGNITSETIPGSIDRTDYYYDEADQLLEAINLTWDTYTEYDNGGNVTYKYVIWTASDGENGFEEIYNFEYGNENWPDQLTKVNDKPITYDAIGNPLSYNGRTYTWTSGRELASITTADMSLSFKYNDSGLRTHKTVTQNGTNITYTYAWSQDNKLISQSDGTTTLYFIYDENDEIIGFAKLTADSSELYYYVKNLQGDVYAIVNSNGTVVAEYLYDAWGYLLEITGSQADTIGFLNPIRYRGYYYDNETGYYYLQSRYYDPVWGRFINADKFDYAKTINLVIPTTQNLFMYCNNSPLVYVDYTGNKSLSIIQRLFLIWFTACLADTLINKETVISNNGKRSECSIDINIEDYDEELYTVYANGYSKVLVKFLTNVIFDKFKKEVGREIVFSNSCLFNEINEHIQGFLYGNGHTDIPLDNWALSIWNEVKGSDELKKRCQKIEIYEKDVFTVKQAIGFDYFNGINSKYYKTKCDPYYDWVRGIRYVLYCNAGWYKNF